MVKTPLATQSAGNSAPETAFFDQISPPQRLALAYAPAAARGEWATLLALDARFARICSTASEPMLAQIRLAWWRDMFARPASDWPEGEPMLAALAGWDGERVALAALATGWEAMVGEPPLDAASFVMLADARAKALGALARILGEANDAQATGLGYRWALADIAGGLSDARERASVIGLLKAELRNGSRFAVARKMRPLAVLETMARRAALEERQIGGAGDFLAGMRAGLIGR